MPRFTFASLVVLPLFLACSDQSTPTPRPPTSSTPRDAGSSGGGTEKSAGLRVATFNTHLFFDTTCDSGNCTSTDFEEVKTQAEFDEKVRLIAGGIERLDADVIALEEIESEASFDALTAKLAADGFAYDVKVLGETGASGSLDVAILARNAKDVVIKTHREDKLTRADGTTTTFARELLEARLTFEAEGLPSQVVFFAAHFRSKAGGDDPGRRLAEAQRAREIMLGVATELPDAYVVLGGDLNDEPGSPPLLALEEGSAIVSLTKDLAAAGTFIFEGKPQQIDHLLATAKTAAHLVPGSAAVVKDTTKGLGGSDHAALEAVLSAD